MQIQKAADLFLGDNGTDGVGGKEWEGDGTS